jgi:hypothetical protein
MTEGMLDVLLGKEDLCKRPESLDVSYNRLDARHLEIIFRMGNLRHLCVTSYSILYPELLPFLLGMALSTLWNRLETLEFPEAC